MSYSQAQLDALRAAVATGATRVTYDGRTTEYRSLDEMMRLIGKIETEIAAAGGTPRTTHVNPTFVRSI